MQRYLYLTNAKYDDEKNRILLYLSGQGTSTKTNYIYKEKFNPFFLVDAPSDIITQLLSEFKKDIKIETLTTTKTKLIANNFQTLQKCHKILTNSLNKNILLIEPERQYLIEKNWSYYDVFLNVSDKIKHIKNQTKIHDIIKETTNELEEIKKIKIIPELTRKLIISNILKIKPEQNIQNDEILNILFENYFFKKNIVLKNKSKIQFEQKKINLKNTMNLDFSNIWPHLLKKEFYNIGYETIDCDCCKPKNIFDTNTLASSFVEVEFIYNGFYFISKDKEWAREYHNTKENKDKRQNYKLQNKLKEYPIGPFFKGQKEKIPLIDALGLVENNNIILTNGEHDLHWFCKKQESFVSEIIKEIEEKLKIIEESINLSTYINYSKGMNLQLENNLNYLQYLTEYSILNNLLEEIPKFMTHTNTKFYDPLISKSIKDIKQQTFIKIEGENNRLIENKENVLIREKTILIKINNYFPKMNLPIPKLITQ